VAIVTGGGTGIGFAVAERLAAEGVRLVLVGRREALLTEAVAKLETEAVAVPGDVREPATLEAALDAAWNGLGRLDILVNNAGGQFIAPAELISRKGWTAVIDVALNATFLWSQGAAQRWIERETPGAIVNMVGPFRDRATPGMAHSGAARAGVMHLTRTLAVEWAPVAIRVNNIGPAVLTPGMRGEFADADATVIDELTNRLPTGRWGTLREVGDLTAFLASDVAGYVTGETVVMDGAAWSAEGFGMRPLSNRRWVTEPDAAARRDWPSALLRERGE
jgi:NAD(P)-dependent dehydrogenase (short-subunit alcohol dehydrogenase family)